ncbi:aminomethyl transferase family protein [Kribbella solani]|uniref:Aminomethyltransferase n=1 Tax=Kribbella solani TaxID=236067 RepID=A0A841DIL0_9ACTN|nr:aminomethyl transferase family protein [Kribbella solani]MBB5977379.1 aminomethyltransferase [Kribbella solani]
MRNVYSDPVAEYELLRGACGLIDYTGLGLLRITGGEAAQFLSQVSTRGVDFLLEGQISSALLLNTDGTLLAEALIHCSGNDYLVEVWPAQAAAVADYLVAAGNTCGQDVNVQDVTDDYRVYGIEGPQSPALAQKFLSFPITSMSYSSFVTESWGDDQDLLVSRTGVSGEYGYKLHIPVAAGNELRDHLAGLGAQPVGLDALDICRMEMRFANLEQEADGATPFETGLQWMVDFGHEFIGKAALTAHWEAGPARRPVCWIAAEGLDDPPAAGTALGVDGEPLGAVTHAVYSPRLERVIGTARVDADVAAAGLELTLEQPEHLVLTTAAPFLVATSFGVPLE